VVIRFKALPLEFTLLMILEKCDAHATRCQHIFSPKVLQKTSEIDRVELTEKV